MALHEVAPDRKGFQIGVFFRCNSIAVRRFGEDQLIALIDIEPRQRFFGQDNAERIADLRNFEADRGANSRWYRRYNAIGGES
jgi:hypothetical protein